jgi:hypothetical protein
LPRNRRQLGIPQYAPFYPSISLCHLPFIPFQKTVAKLLKTLPALEKKLRDIGNSKREIGWGTSKSLPLISRTDPSLFPASFPADEFIVTVSVSRKQGAAVPHPRSHIGVKDHHRNTTDYDVEPLGPLPPIELALVRDLDVENAVRVRLFHTSFLQLNHR